MPVVALQLLFIILHLNKNMQSTLSSSQRSRRRSKKGKVDVVAPQVQKAYGQQPPTTEGVLEGYYLVFLALFFVVILAEGLFIALSVRERRSAHCSMPLLIRPSQATGSSMVCAGVSTRNC